MIQRLEQIAEGFRESVRLSLQYPVIPAVLAVGLIANVIGFQDYLHVKRIADEQMVQISKQMVQISKQMAQLDIINDNFSKREDPNYVPPYR